MQKKMSVFVAAGLLAFFACEGGGSPVSGDSLSDAVAVDGIMVDARGDAGTDAGSVPTCPASPDYCEDGAAVFETGGWFTEVPHAGFRMVSRRLEAQSDSLIAAIVAHDSVASVTLDDVLTDLDHDGPRVDAILSVENLSTAFHWDKADRADETWYPQGISGNRNASHGSAASGHILVAGWYHKPENDAESDVDKGSRVTFVDVSNPDAVRYRHVLLVKPVASGEGIAGFEPVMVHAGGLAWVGQLLYVADTNNGLRVFDMDRLLKLPVEPADAFGFVSEIDGYRAWGFRYVLPEINSYQLAVDSCCARFSFLAVNGSEDDGQSLLAGEYDLETARGRLHRWPLSYDDDTLLDTAGVVAATAAFNAGVEQMQGAVTVDGRTFISTSRFKETEPASWGTLLVGEPGRELRRTTWPWGAEDLYYDAEDDWIWSLTEHPDNRWVFGVPRQALLDAAE